MESHRYSKGIVLTEALLSVAVFALLVTGVGGALLYAQESRAIAGDRIRATLIAEEGLEAVRTIRDRDVTALTDGTYGLTRVGSEWQLSGGSDTYQEYAREVTITSVSEHEWEVTSAVSWNVNLQRTQEITLHTRLTDWQREVVPEPDCSGPPAERPSECNNPGSEDELDCSGPPAQRPPECG